MLTNTPCRMFGERHLWNDQIMAAADELTAAVMAQYDEPVRWIHVYLNEIHGGDTVVARIQLAPVAGPELTVIAVRNQPLAALESAFAALRMRLSYITAVPA
jgi:phenylpyruvate tautomerase PptA (4-oxalocrotonate tautomerase family)